MTMDILAIETFSWSPHLETTGEICIQETSSGRSVGFVFLNIDNPDDEIQPRVRRVGGRRWRKIATLNRILSARGVAVLRAPDLSKTTREDVALFGRQRPQKISELSALTYKGAALGMGAASSLISRVGESEPDLDRWRKRVNRYLNAAALVYESALALLLLHKPKMVLIYNGRFSSAKAVAEAARALSIPCRFHERGANYERYELFDRPPHDFAYLRECIASAWAKARLMDKALASSYFERRRDGDGIGWLSHTDAQQRGYTVKASARRRVVYFSSSDDEFAAVGDLIAHPLFDTQFEALDFLLAWVAQQRDTELVVRVHPHMRHKSAKARTGWDDLRAPNLLIVPSDSKVDSYALVDTADVVVVFESTMGVEASYWGKPVIILDDALYRGLGCVYEPKTVEELESLIGDRSLQSLPRERCLPYGHYMLTYGRRFEFYRPTSIFQGKLLGVELSVESKFVRHLKRSAVGQQLKKLLFASR